MHVDGKTFGKIYLKATRNTFLISIYDICDIYMISEGTTGVNLLVGVLSYRREIKTFWHAGGAVPTPIPSLSRTF